MNDSTHKVLLHGICESAHVEEEKPVHGAPLLGLLGVQVLILLSAVLVAEVLHHSTTARETKR